MSRRRAAIALMGLALLSSGAARGDPTPPLAELLARSPPGDWRAIDPRNLVVLTLPQGRVTIELAPAFAPKHVANLRKLARARFFDGLYVVRAQDNYVVQWGDAEAKRPLGEASRTLKAEFDRGISGDLAFDPLPDVDTYAPKTGFSDGFPAARDPASGRTWLVHCYGMVGAGRDNDADSGGGPELYAVIGQAPRQLDRNVTLLGRVVEGMDLLSALPRGHGELGFYDKPEQRTPIVSLRLAADLPAAFSRSSKPCAPTAGPSPPCFRPDVFGTMRGIRWPPDTSTCATSLYRSDRRPDPYSSFTSFYGQV